MPPPTCKAYPIALLLRDHCAIYARLPTSPFYAIHHTILVMAISCRGQAHTGILALAYCLLLLLPRLLYAVWCLYLVFGVYFMLHSMLTKLIVTVTVTVYDVYV